MAIGWDGCAQSVRSVVAALPLLRRGRSFLTIGDKPDADIAASTAYLRWHGIDAEPQRQLAVPGVRAPNASI